MKFTTTTITTTILALVVTLPSSVVFASTDKSNVSVSISNASSVTASTSRAVIVYNKFLNLVKQPNKLTESTSFLKAHIYEVSSSQQA